MRRGRLERSPPIYAVMVRASDLYVRFRFERRIEVPSPDLPPGRVPILLYKHQRMADIPVVGSSLHRWLGMQASWVMKYGLGALPLGGWLLKKLGGISIIRPSRDRGAAGRRALRHLWEDRLDYVSWLVTERREPLCIAPEGTRVPGRMGPPEAGLLLRLLEDGIRRGPGPREAFPWSTLFIPVGLEYGPERPLLGRQPVTVRFAAPLTLRPSDFPALTREEIRGRLMERLISPAMREIARLSRLPPAEAPGG